MHFLPKRHLAALSLGILMLFTACSTHSTTLRENTSDIFQQINLKAQEKSARVQLGDGRKALAYQLQAAADSFRWKDRQGQTMSSSTDQVVFVEFTNPGKGLLSGLGKGFLIGAGGGAAAGLAQGDDKEGFLRLSGEDKALVGAAVFGAAGGIVGAGVGILHGKPDRFMINDLSNFPDYPANKSKRWNWTASTTSIRTSVLHAETSHALSR